VAGDVRVVASVGHQVRGRGVTLVADGGDEARAVGGASAPIAAVVTAPPPHLHQTRQARETRHGHEERAVHARSAKVCRRVRHHVLPHSRAANRVRRCHPCVSMRGSWMRGGPTCKCIAGTITMGVGHD
jgi:hypothetical protein